MTNKKDVETEKKQVRVNLDADVHDKLAIIASINGHTKIGDYINAYFKKYTSSIDNKTTFEEMTKKFKL
jgi:hypothetical protein